MRNLIAALLAALALPASAGAAALPEAAVPVMTYTRLGSSTLQLTCPAAWPLACHYLILKSLCQERFLNDGTKERACRYMEAVPPFKLRPGETKTIAKLPSDFVYTMKQGAAPTAAQAAGMPIPH